MGRSFVMKKWIYVNTLDNIDYLRIYPASAEEKAVISTVYIDVIKQLRSSTRFKCQLLYDYNIPYTGSFQCRFCMELDGYTVWLTNDERRRFLRELKKEKPELFVS